MIVGRMSDLGMGEVAMATTVPYTTPYARSGAAVRQSPRVDSDIIRFIFLCVIGAVLIALVQLYLTGLATDTINQVNRLEKENALIQAQVDEEQARVEELRSPRRIEADATRLGLKPFKNVEFMRP